MALGKNTTIGKVIDMVRVEDSIVQEDRITDTLLLDRTNINVADLAKRLNGVNAPFYMSTATLTLSGSSYPITSLAIDRIVKIVDGTLGIILSSSPADYENISLLTSQNGSSMYFTVEGETIRIFKGATLAAHGTITIYYYRVPTFATAKSDYPDIPDSFTAMIVKMLSADVYAYRNKGKRDANKDMEIQKNIQEVLDAYKQ